MVIQSRSKKGSQEIFAGFLRTFLTTTAWSYCLQTNTTTVVVLVANDGNIRKNLLEALQKPEAHMLHPLFIPTDLCRREFHYVEGGSYAERNVLLEIEESVGLGENVESSADETFLKDFEKNVRLIQYHATTLVSSEALLQRLAPIFESHLPRAMEEIQAFVSPEIHKFGPEIDVWIRHYANAGDRSGSEVAPLLHTSESTPLTNAKYTSILSNRDAKQNAQIASAAKRDSSSMKSLVALSIIFAPPSCIATIASMPMLSWQPGQFWIFWAYTVPITGVVIIIWIFYMFFINQRNRDSDNRIAGNEPKPRGIKNFWGAFQKGSQPPTPSADGQKGKDIADASREEGKDLESGSPGEALPPEETRRVDERPSLRQILHLIWLFLFWQ
ncbi:hypothetical protein IWX90DRAFT_414471 [Phyllosticta citrichinensis]|uniref:Uncharacterized protein n=1 Tax=Phyllosticta citrichinensis TaxID=1130410 RepID=A0ABR1XXY5_9PEZI